MSCDKVLLGLLEKLSSAEETVIRTNTAESISSCFKIMDKDSIIKLGLPLFGRMKKGGFGQRITCINIFPDLLKQTEKDIRKEMLDTYKKFIRDDMPMVRTQAYRRLPDLVEVCDKSFYTTYCRLFLHHLVNEVSPGQAKHALVNIVLAILRKMKEAKSPVEDIQQCTWTWLSKVGKNDAWRMRNIFAENLVTICELYDSIGLSKLNSTGVLPICLELLSDTEPQVRELALRKFSIAVKYMEIAQEHKETLQEKLCALAYDETHQAVREVVAANIVDLFHKAELDMNKLLEILKAFKDESAQAGSKVRRKCL
eukprot:UN06306